ncbi:MAG: MMPL family transporter [Bacteroidales bacterium]
MTNFILKYRRFLIAIPLTVGILFAVLIPFSKTDPEIRNYVPRHIPSREVTDIIEKEFGIQDMIMILFSDSSILTESNLENIKATGDGISGLYNIRNVITPFSIKTIESENDALLAKRLIDSIPKNFSESEALKKRIRKNKLAGDIVISGDFRMAAITATIDTTEGELVTMSRIDSITKSHEGNAKVLKGGLPYIRKYILTDVKKDAAFLVPAALLIMLLVLRLSLGNWRSIIMPFSVVLISTSASMGLIPLLGWNISILTLLVPIILVAVANNYGIYLAARFQELRKEGLTDTRETLNQLLGSLNMPILFSGLTTIAGILGLLTHSIIPARQASILAATGVTLALVISLLFVPALIAGIKPALKRTMIDRSEKNPMEPFLSFLAGFIIKRSGSILLFSLVFTVLVSTGAFLLKTETNQEKFFPAGHPIRETSEKINESFGGSQTVSVMITGDILEPEVMQKIDELTTRLELTGGVGKVFSVSKVIRQMTKVFYDSTETEYDAIPATREGIAQLFELYYMSGDPDDFNQLVNRDYSKAHLLIKLSNPDHKVITSVKKVIGTISKGMKAEVLTGGYAIIMSDFASLLIKGQVTSLLLAVITVFLLLWIIFRSPAGGLIGSIPLVASIFILFGFMGLAGIALDSATALISSIMIGVGVDFTIQYIWCFTLQLKTGNDFSLATSSAIRKIGRSIIINAIGVMAGFAVLVFSGFTSIRFFGWLIIISMSSCLIGAIIVIPAFILRFKPAFITKLSNRIK